MAERDRAGVSNETRPLGDREGARPTSDRDRTSGSNETRPEADRDGARPVRDENANHPVGERDRAGVPESDSSRPARDGGPEEGGAQRSRDDEHRPLRPYEEGVRRSAEDEDSAQPVRDEDSTSTRPDHETRTDRDGQQPDPALVGVIPAGAGPEGGAHTRPPRAEAGDGSIPPHEPNSGENRRSAPKGDDNRGRCGVLAVRDLMDRFPKRTFRLPEREVGAEGMST
ncbi:hypothetical protein ACW9HQ_42970, partial [Nocardia gipuzkoensis]